MSSFFPILKNGWINFKRNSYLSAGTIGVMTLCLILCMGLLGFQFLSTDVVHSLQDKVDISVYFKSDAPEDQIQKVKSDVALQKEVKNVDYTSKDKALDDFKKRHAADPLIQDSLAQLDTNPLSASINIKAQETAQYAQISKFLENHKFRSIIDKINFYENKAVIEKIQALSSSIENWALLSTAILASIAVLVTFNTIRLTIFNQKKEIEIMRLVGASNWQIRAPYLVEGAMYGIFSAFISITLFYPLIYIVSGKISSFTASNIWVYFLQGSLQIVGIVLFVGVTLGVVSSAIAVRKHLKI